MRYVEVTASVVVVVAGVCGTLRLQRELWWRKRVYLVCRGYSVRCGGGSGCMRYVEVTASVVVVEAGVCGTSRLQRQLWWWKRVYAVR